MTPVCPISYLVKFFEGDIYSSVVNIFITPPTMVIEEVNCLSYKEIFYWFSFSKGETVITVVILVLCVDFFVQSHRKSHISQ